MTRRHLILLCAILLILVTAGVASAQDNTPRELPGDLVINAGFEPDASFWIITNAVGDKVKCGDLGHADSDCAFMFKGGAGEKTQIKQVYTPGVNASGTQYIYFNANIRPLSAGQSVTFFVTIKFTGGAPALKKKFTYTSVASALTYTAVEFDTDNFNPANVKKVIFGAKNNSLSGKAYIDGFTVGAFND